MSNRTFRNILIPKEFDSLTTPEKIKLALEKGIFKIASNYPKGSDFSELDFSIYDDKKFDFLEHYDIDDYGIMLNYDIPYEICNLLCLRVSHSYKSHQFLKEIQFKLEAYNTPEEKLNFLNGEIEEINPFQLEELLVDFDKKKSSLELSGLQPMELVSRNKNLLYDWLTNGIIYEANFEAYKTVNTFCDSYEKFLFAKHCYNEIKSIKNQNDQGKHLFGLTNLKSENGNLQQVNKENNARNKKDTHWFRSGILFADGTMDLYWNENRTGIKNKYTIPIIAREVGLPKAEKYILASFNGYPHSDKNIFNNPNKLKILIDHLKENNVEIASSFLKKIQPKTN